MQQMGIALGVFIIERSEKIYVVYWHIYGEQQIKLNINLGKAHVS